MAYAVIQTKADGAINFTASPNPPEYNGIKFSTPDGCPALPEVTKKIEAEIAAGDNQRPPAKRSTLSRQAGPVKKSPGSRPPSLNRLCARLHLRVIHTTKLWVPSPPTVVAHR